MKVIQTETCLVWLLWDGISFSDRESGNLHPRLTVQHTAPLHYVFTQRSSASNPEPRLRPADPGSNPEQ